MGEGNQIQNTKEIQEDILARLYLNIKKADDLQVELEKLLQQ